MSRAAQKAVALAQQEKSTWTRADLIKYLGRVLPRTGLDPSAAAALLEDLADRALRSEFEPVLCLEAPESAHHTGRARLARDRTKIEDRSQPSTVAALSHHCMKVPSGAWASGCHVDL